MADAQLLTCCSNKWRLHRSCAVAGMHGGCTKGGGAVQVTLLGDVAGRVESDHGGCSSLVAV
jgi:hypothetical protein